MVTEACCVLTAGVLKVEFGFSQRFQGQQLAKLCLHNTSDLLLNPLMKIREHNDCLIDL